MLDKFRGLFNRRPHSKKLEEPAVERIPTSFTFTEILVQDLSKKDRTHVDRPSRYDSKGRFFVCEVDEKNRTYVIQSEGSRCVIFVDVDNSETERGFGSMDYPSDREGDGQLATHMTGTYSYTPKTGLGTRRLLMMNAFSKEKFGVPLCSGYAPSDSARSTWRGLVGEGKARSFMHQGRERYIFI